MEAFWNSIAAYNAATWPFQLALVIIAAVLTLILRFRPSVWARNAMKILMVTFSLWIAFVYYLGFCGERDYSFVMIIFWCMVAAAWIYDLVTGFSSFSKSQGRYRFWGVLMLLLPLVCPLLSVARGLTFPEITTPMLPSGVALYMLGVLMAFNRKINFFAFIFVVHWALIAISKIVLFSIPEDILLAAACLPAMAIFFRQAAEKADPEGRKPSRLMMNILIFMVVLLIAVCMVIPNV